MKILIIGGVAGGASAAARARRIDENAEIVLFERGEYISFANCGLPYHISGEISDRDKLLMMTPEKLKGRSSIDVRTEQEVIDISPKDRSIKVKELNTGETYQESYDKLILSPGSSPIHPPIPGANDPGVDVLWTIPDMDKIINKIKGGAKKAVVVGAGFIGLEVVENLVERGLEVSLVEMLSQVLPSQDKEMTQPIKQTLEEKNVNLMLEEKLTKIEKKSDNSFKVHLESGTIIDTDLVILAVGVKPNTEIAKKAGLDLNKQGAIKVNKHLNTSDKDIYAVGDAVEINNPLTGKPAMVPLAGPANKQGRIAADNALGENKNYEGSISTSICRVFDISAASTGLNEKFLDSQDIDYKKFYIIPGSHASYYPGWNKLYIKVLFDKNGQILGAQITGGKEGVDKRIDVLATSIQKGLTFDDLEELDLAYAPPYGSAKDPINFVGFVGNNIMKEYSSIITPDQISDSDYLLDVRTKDEFLSGSIPGAINIPLGELRKSSEQLPAEKNIVVFCRVGIRGYLAERILKAQGFKVKNLSGGFEMWKLFNPSPSSNKNPDFDQEKTGETMGKNLSKQDITEKSNKVEVKVDACGLQCPGPIMRVREELEKLNDSKVLKIVADDKGFLKDLPAWCKSTGNTLLSIDNNSGNIEALIQKGKNTEDVSVTTENNKSTTIVLFSNDLDKCIAAMIIATGFASMGHKVSIFFTFWGINVLRKNKSPKLKKGFLDKMFGFMMPKGPNKLALSKMNMMGMGTSMMKHVMKSKNVNSLPELMEQAQELGVKFLACEMAMNIMGIQEEELLDDIERAGVANFASLSENSNSTLFI